MQTYYVRVQIAHPLCDGRRIKPENDAWMLLCGDKRSQFDECWAYFTLQSTRSPVGVWALRFSQNGLGFNISKYLPTRWMQSLPETGLYVLATTAAGEEPVSAESRFVSVREGGKAAKLGTYSSMSWPVPVETVAPLTHLALLVGLPIFSREEGGTWHIAIWRGC